MKFIIVFFALFAIVMARPGKDAEVLRYDSDVQPEGFKFGFETSDGTSHDSEGHLKDAGTDHAAIAVRGSYKYTDEYGQTYQITYVADENGFQPKGAHLPVA